MLTAARGDYEAADAAYRAAGGRQPHDEPDWRPEGVERLVALILQGPITPAADTERQRTGTPRGEATAG